MESNIEFKKINIENCTCCYFDDIIKLEDFDPDNSLTDEKSYENILIYDISYKTFIGSKPLRCRFDKIDQYVRVYDGTRYFVFIEAEKYDFIFHD